MEFKDLLNKLEKEFEEAVYFSELQWLSCWKILAQIFNPKEEIQTIMERNGKPVTEFNNDKWMYAFNFLVDITTHLGHADFQCASNLKKVQQLPFLGFLHKLCFAGRVSQHLQYVIFMAGYIYVSKCSPG